MTAMTISELGRSGGVGVETVRFYQRKGLLGNPLASGDQGARAGRHYGPEDLRRLRFVRSAQAAGFTLNEISELLALDRTGERPRARAMATARIEALDKQIADLQRARRALEGLARECASSAAGPCPIIEAFEE